MRRPDGAKRPDSHGGVSVLVQHSVRRTLFSMAWPMLAGTFAWNAYSITDAWFMSRLGTLPLAAMAFAIPVVMFLMCIAGGLGSGVTPLMSHALGRGDKAAAARLVSHGIALVVTVAALLAVAGYLSIDWVFARLGADARTLPLIRAYMSAWYCGAPLMAMQFLGHGLLISSGDSRGASTRMVLGAVVNAILNPILIFGYLGVPAMGIRGSALATVIAQAVSTAWLFWLLHRKHRLLRFEMVGLHSLLASFRGILAFGIPGMMSMVLMPVSTSIVTWALARFGTEPVAASGAAGRTEMVAFVIPMALGISLTPFVSQNCGAGRLDRVREAFRVSTTFALIYGVLIAAVFIVAAPWMARAFSDDPAVIGGLVAYIRITSIGYGMTEVHRYCTFFLTGLHRPAQSVLLDTVRVLVLLGPLVYLGSTFVGVHGVFAGRLLADVLSGCIGLMWVVRIMRNTPPGSAVDNAAVRRQPDVGADRSPGSDKVDDAKP